MNWKSAGALSFIAEGIGFSALVMDQTPTNISHSDLVASIQLFCNGDHKVSGATGDDGLDPVEMLGFLLEHCGRYGHTLQKGHLVSSGTQTVQFSVPIEKSHITAKWSGGEMGFHIDPK